MEDIYASKILPSSHIQPTVHSKFPTEKISLVDHSIEKIEPCTIFPESTDLNEQSPIEFIIHDAAQHYIDLSSLQLEVKLQLLTPEALAPDPPSQVFFTNNLLSSLFPIRKIFINNVCIETQYAGNHLGRIKHLINTSPSIITNRAEARGLFNFTKDRLGSPISNAVCTANANRKIFSKKENIHLKGFLDLDICSVNKWLVDLCTLRLVLGVASDKLVINAIGDNINYTYKIKSIKLHFDRILPSNSGFISATKSLQKNPIEYLFTRHVVHSEILAAGQSSLTINRPFNNRIPSKLYIFMTKQKADQGQYSEDAEYFQTNNLINYRLMIDGKLLVDQACNPADNCLSAYVNSLNAHNNDENFIPFNLYTSGCFLLVVKTNHSQENELSFERKGNLSIHLRFNDAVVDNQIIYTFGVCHSTFEITADRNCITNYSY